jgi:hypothetical protein
VTGASRPQTRNHMPNATAPFSNHDRSGNRKTYATYNYALWAVKLIYIMFKFTGRPAHASTILVDSMQDGQISSTSVAYFTEVTCCLGQDSTKAPALYGVLHHHGPTVQTIRDMWKLKVVLPPVSRVNADTPPSSLMS